MPAAPRPKPVAAAGALYTDEQRRRRDATRWTLVQGILAPVQFLVFLVSLGLVLRYVATGEGFGLAAASVVLKTAILYLIMVTGSIWEKVVFDRWLFAPAFYWEDVFSMLVLALHSAYLIGLWMGLAPMTLMTIALLAYLTYVINAAQFIWKLRMARLQSAQQSSKQSSKQSSQQSSQQSSRQGTRQASAADGSIEVTA